MNMNSKTKPVVGIMVIVIGLLHTAMGVTIWLTDEAATITTVEHVWFTAFGVLAVALGVVIVELERARGAVSPPVLIGIAAVMAYGLLLVGPASGFIALLIPIGCGLFGWLRRRRIAHVA